MKKYLQPKTTSKSKRFGRILQKGAEELQDIEKDKLGGSIKRRKLSDGTVIKLRQKSKSGGSAIEIEKESTDQIKIHSIKDKK